MAAERGGANRIELCRDLALDGLTPDADLMRAVRSEVRLPIFAMIRPRAGDFVYSEAEFAAMQRDIESVKEQGMDGAVLGILTKDGAVDVERSRQLVELAHPLPVTFHRAFDDCADLRKSLEDVIETGAERILTSGGAATAAAGVPMLRELVASAGERVIILPGKGINAANLQDIVVKTMAREFHSGLSSAIPAPRADVKSFEMEVRKLATLLFQSTG